MLVNIGNCESVEELQKRISAAAEEAAKTITHHIEDLKTKNCKVTMIGETEAKYCFDNLAKCDFNDKDFIVFIKKDGTTRMIRRDEIKEIYIYEN